MMQISNEQLEKYPPWKEALERFRATNFAYNDIVTHEWFYEALGLEKPNDKTPFGKATEVQLAYLDNMTQLRMALQLEDLLCLESEFTKGYRIVHPTEQTALAMVNAGKSMEKVLRKAARAVGNIRLDELTDQQRRENMDARAKISSIAGLSKRINAPF